MQSLKALPRLKPFDKVKAEEIQNTVEALFTEQVGQAICEYFAAKAKLSLLPQDEIAVGTAERIKQTTDYSDTEQNIAEIQSVLRFFDNLADDLRLAHKELCSTITIDDVLDACDELSDMLHRCFYGGEGIEGYFYRLMLQGDYIGKYAELFRSFTTRNFDIVNMQPEEQFDTQSAK